VRVLLALAASFVALLAGVALLRYVTFDGQRPTEGASTCRGSAAGQDLFVDGWWNHRIAVTVGTSLCTADPGTGAWATVPASKAGAYVSDGATLAGGGDDTVLSFVTAEGTERLIPLGPWEKDWSAWGRTMSVAPGGGYVLGLLPQVVAISLDGRVTEGPLPDGYLVLAATSQPDTFILRKDDRTAPEAMQGPFSAYLWRRGGERPRAVMDNVWSARSAEDGLAWLEGNGDAWHFLDADGNPGPILTPRSGSAYDPDPSGKLVVEATGVAAGCEGMSPPSCETRLIDSVSGSVLAACRCSAQSIRWAPDGAAFSNPIDRNPGVTILNRSGAIKIPLPE
jgi:hypothetical protein